MRSGVRALAFLAKRENIILMQRIMLVILVLRERHQQRVLRIVLVLKGMLAMLMVIAFLVHLFLEPIAVRAMHHNARTVQMVLQYIK